MQFTTVDRIFSKIHRDLRDTNFNETDVIEWAGEALEFLRVPQIQDEGILFTEVRNFEADLPTGFQMVLQIARNNYWNEVDDKAKAGIPCSTKQELDHPNLQQPPEVPFIDDDCTEIWYRPWFNMQWQYIPWTTNHYYKNHYTPVKLANNTFFNSLVCKENDQTIYENCADEYTIVGTTQKKLRFSFKEGYIAMAYIKNAVDPKSGYPLIPDQISFITAITYYIKWKIAEYHSWSGRQGFENQSDRAEARWLKYARQAKNYAKMPKSLDDFESHLRQTHTVIPRMNRYFNYFGNLSGQDTDSLMMKNSIYER